MGTFLTTIKNFCNNFKEFILVPFVITLFVFVTGLIVWIIAEEFRVFFILDQISSIFDEGLMLLSYSFLVWFASLLFRKAFPSKWSTGAADRGAHYLRHYGGVVVAISAFALFSLLFLVLFFDEQFDWRIFPVFAVMIVIYFLFVLPEDPADAIRWLGNKCGVPFSDLSNKKFFKTKSALILILLIFIPSLWVTFKYDKFKVSTELSLQAYKKLYELSTNEGITPKKYLKRLVEQALIPNKSEQRQ